MIFPYTKKAEALARFASSLQGFEISSLVQLKGWGRLGEMHKCAGKEISVTDNIITALDAADALCVVNTHIKISIENTVLPVVSQALQLEKEVFMCRPLMPEEKRMMQKLPGSEKIHFYGETPPHTTAKPMSISTPVIGVAGVISSIGKWPVELSLKQVFEELGYDVLLIGSRKEAPLFGGYCLPDYLFETNLTETEKILSVNHFVATLVSEKSPDIVLLGIPGCVTTYDPNTVKDYGVTAFEISQAVSIDQLVLCSLAQEYEAEYFGLAGEMVEKRPGVPVIAHHLAPYTFDQAYMLENDVVSLLTLDDTYVNRKIEEWSLPNVRNYTEPEAARQLCGSIIEQYGEYGALAMET